MADKKVPKKMKNTQEQDYITNKIMVVFSLCLFGVMALWYVNNLLFHSSRCKSSTWQDGVGPRWWRCQSCCW